MKTFHVKICAILIVMFLFWGCPSTPPKAEKGVPKPEITLQMANLNLANLNRRIERKDIVQLAKTLRREQVEVLAVQNISRYPGVTTRVDFVNELSTQSEMSNVFGEMFNNSGRQIGNAIFSTYPILSHYNQSFDKIKSANFEAALTATIDAGVRSIIVVSAQFPSKASMDDQTQCVKLVAAMNPDTSKTLMIVAGNVPVVVKSVGSFEEARASSDKSVSSQLWYTSIGALQVLSSRAVETGLGTVLVTQLGIFRQK